MLVPANIYQGSGWLGAAAIASLPALGYFAACFVAEYQGWLRMGRGGLPYNFFGYCINLYLTFRYGRKDTTSLGLYERPERHSPAWREASTQERLNAQSSWLANPLPIRGGPQSRAIHYCAPQREKNAGEYLDSKLKERYLEMFEDLVKNEGAVEWRTSVLERRGRAMFLKDAYDLPNPLAYARRELAHLHDSDISGHILLSFADAKEVLAKGWGERHRVAGTIAPLGYMIIYQPRNEEEIEIFMSILSASIAYGKSNGKKSTSD